MLDEGIAETSRSSLETLSTIAATVPAPPPVNPLEDMLREIAPADPKQWLDDHLPAIVDEHVKREITRSPGARF